MSERYHRIGLELLAKIERSILYDVIWSINCKPEIDFCCGSCLWVELGAIMGIDGPIRWDRM